jgi:hypothetical protein
VKKHSNPLTDSDVRRKLTLQIPELDSFIRTSDPRGQFSVTDAAEFCALYKKIERTSFVTEGIARIDFDATPLRRRQSWIYGLRGRVHPQASGFEPLRLVMLQSVGAWTTCEIRCGSKHALVITNPHIAIYARSASTPNPGGPLPVPTLPDVAKHGYRAVYEYDVREVAIELNGGRTSITER